MEPFIRTSHQMFRKGAAFLAFLMVPSFIYAQSPGDGERERTWRVSTDETPPYQVQRTVNTVESTATAIADRLSPSKAPERVSKNSSSDGTSSSAPDEDSRAKDPTTSPNLVEWVGWRGDDETYDMALYRDDKSWLEAMKLLQKGECEKAKKRLNEDEFEHLDEFELPVQYALGRIESCASDDETETHGEVLRRLSRSDTPIGRLASQEVDAHSTSGAKDGEAAKTIYQIVQQSKKIQRRDGFSEAQSYLTKWRQKISSAWRNYRLEMAEVNLLKRAGESVRAGRKLLDIYREARDWRIGGELEAKLEELDEATEQNVFPFGERIDRMRDLIFRGQFHRAREVSIQNAKRRGVSGDEIEGWTYYRRALQAEAEKRREKAADLFERAERLVEDPAVRSRIYYGWARALRRLDEDERAIELYRRLCREYPEHKLCDDALYYVGLLLQYEQQFEMARDAFARLLNEYPDTERGSEARWRLGFSNYLLKDYPAAASILKKEVRSLGANPDSEDRRFARRLKYWLGVSLLETDPNEARKVLQSVINENVFGWYGQLASERLAEAGFSPVRSAPVVKPQDNPLDHLKSLRLSRHSRLDEAVILTKLGLFEEALNLLERETGRFPVVDGSQKFLAALYLVNDRPQKAYWTMERRLEGESVGYYNVDAWKLAYPSEYLDLSKRYGREYQVSPFLVQAVLRKESGFQVRAASSAGARGLMQLMPETARFLSRHFFEGKGSVSREELEEPKTNIRLGALYVKLKTVMANDQIPVALAGYNAGAGPLKSWLDRFGERQLDAWVELITYRQARDYVKKVYSSYVAYRALYGDGSLPELTLEVPKQLKNWETIKKMHDEPEPEPRVDKKSQGQSTNSS